jgi:hypothetical protein
MHAERPIGTGPGEALSVTARNASPRWVSFHMAADDAAGSLVQESVPE